VRLGAEPRKVSRTKFFAEFFPSKEGCILVATCLCERQRRDTGSRGSVVRLPPRPTGAQVHFEALPLPQNWRRRLP
jgi:hypothetical protein